MSGEQWIHAERWAAADPAEDLGRFNDAPGAIVMFRAELIEMAKLALAARRRARDLEAVIKTLGYTSDAVRRATER